MNTKIIALAGLTAVALAAATGGYLYLRGGGSESHEVALAHDPVSHQPRAEDIQKMNEVKAFVRDLGLAQDGVAQGVKDAVDLQDHIIIEIAETLDEIDVQNWLSPPDYNSVLVYVLSGGEPDVLRKIVDAGAGSEFERRLAEGVLQFAENDPEKARVSLEMIEPRLLEAQLMGPVSLAKASVYAKKEPEKAIALLDDARLINPHTAIEEAAIRRQLPLLIRKGDVRRSMLLATDYIHRFGKSAYSSSFLEDFSRFYVSDAKHDSEFAALQFKDMIDSAADEVRAEAFLAMSREALLKGRLILGRAMAQSAIEVAGQSSIIYDRARLYLAAANAPTENAAAAQARLAEPIFSGMSDEDVEIRNAAKEVAGSVLRKPDVELERVKSSGVLADIPSGRMASSNRALARAHNAIKDVDAIMAESNQ